MFQKHIRAVCSFFLMPVTLTWVAVLQPRKLAEISSGSSGVSYSLTAAFWSLVVAALLEQSYIREEQTAHFLSTVYTMPFAFEVLTIPTLLLYLVIFSLLSWLLVKEPKERSDLVSLSLILFFLATFPILVLSRLPIYPSSLEISDASWNLLMEGNLGVWVYLLVPVGIGLVLYPMNAPRVAPSLSFMRHFSYFALVTLAVIFFAWEVEPIVTLISYYTVFILRDCDDWGCVADGFHALGAVLFS